MSWLLLVDGPKGGAENMALDAALLEAAEAEGLRTLRLYTWSPGTISFGRNEPALRRYDRAAIAAKALPTVRRPTGGRAVWHHREVTYAVAAPADTFGDLRATYVEIHTMLAEALRSMGAAVGLAGERPATPVGAGACFASAAGGEVMSTHGLKVVGSAQVRSAGAFLQHGSILLTAEQEVIADVTKGAADRPSATGVDQLVSPALATFENVTDAIARTASRRWRIPPGGSVPELVWFSAERLRARYADDAWTWRL